MNKKNRKLLEKMNKDNLRKISVILLAGLIILGGWNMLTTGAKSKDLDPNAIYLSDINHFQQMNEVYATYFKENCPSRAAFQVAALPKNALVEIQAVACQ